MADTFDIIVPVLFGLEAFAAREIRALGYETSSVEDGRVEFKGDAEAVYLANMWLRTGERVLIKIGEFSAVTFDELFEGAKACDWERFIRRDDMFPVTGYSMRSQLASVRDCQAIIKKAAAVSLGEAYGTERLPETGAMCKIRFSILKDRVTLMLDTTGVPLHKRGYRAHHNAAPLKETIAAALVYLSRWRYEDPLADPFAGSGTIPVEAALIKRNIAPGLFRSFAFEEMGFFDKHEYGLVREEALDARRIIPLDITASDKDPACVKLIKENADNAGVADCIYVKRLDARNIAFDKSGGTIITNPPYGERLGDKKECRSIYRGIGKSFSALDNWAAFILTSDEEFERAYGRPADKKRKLYNGMLKCNVYQYFKKRI